jgi:hypothetical protein
VAELGEASVAADEAGAASDENFQGAATAHDEKKLGSKYIGASNQSSDFKNTIAAKC